MFGFFAHVFTQPTDRRQSAKAEQQKEKDEEMFLHFDQRVRTAARAFDAKTLRPEVVHRVEIIHFVANFVQLEEHVIVFVFRIFFPFDVDGRTAIRISKDEKNVERIRFEVRRTRF